MCCLKSAWSRCARFRSFIKPLSDDLRWTVFRRGIGPDYRLGMLNIAAPQDVLQRPNRLGDASPGSTTMSRCPQWIS